VTNTPGRCAGDSWSDVCRVASDRSQWKSFRPMLWQKREDLSPCM